MTGRPLFVHLALPLLLQDSLLYVDVVLISGIFAAVLRSTETHTLHFHHVAFLSLQYGSDR